MDSTSIWPRLLLRNHQPGSSFDMFASSAFRSALREAAPNLSKRYFSCRAPRCVNQSIRSSTCRKAIRQITTSTRPLRTQFGAVVQQGSQSPLDTLISSIPKSKAQTPSSFPETTSNSVAYWLFASAASVFGIVVFGGLTRLTESGYG